MIDKAVTLITQTPDVELLRVYGCVNGEPGNLEADAFSTESDRQGPNL